MRNIKDYELKLERLIHFATALNVKLVFCEVHSEGVWIPSNKTIKIDDQLSEADTLGTLLHELGHSLDDLIVSSEDLNNAYSSVYVRKITKRQLKLVVDAEKRAWQRGRYIASRLNIRLGKWYTDLETQAIKDYKKT